MKCLKICCQLVNLLGVEELLNDIAGLETANSFHILFNCSSSVAFVVKVVAILPEDVD